MEITIYSESIHFNYDTDVVNSKYKYSYKVPSRPGRGNYFIKNEFYQEDL